MKAKQNLYSDIEGLRIGIEIEQRGQRFYRLAMEHCQIPEQQDLFRYLMQEEVRHSDVFSGMLKNLSVRHGQGSDDYLFDEEASRYLTAIAETHVFPPESQAAEVIGQLSDLGGILRLALQAEKDSILFYDELAANAKFPDSRDVFLKMKKEEQGHVMLIKKKMQEFGIDG
ncbi:MAG: ferritin family protein [Negativicutes bacterium]|nr:ferritin family protein [Negativicutes bacterium]